MGYGKITESVSETRSVASRLRLGQDRAGALLELPVLKSWADCFLQKHPTLTDQKLIQTLAECDLVHKTSQSIAQIALFAKDRPSHVGIGPYLFTRFFKDHFKLKNPDLPLPPDAKLLKKIYQFTMKDQSLSNEFKEKFNKFWLDQQGSDDSDLSKLSPLLLLKAWEEAFASLTEDSLDPKYLGLLWIDILDEIPAVIDQTNALKAHRSQWLSEQEEV